MAIRHHRRRGRASTAPKRLTFSGSRLEAAVSHGRVAIPKSLEALVRHKVEEGGYASEAEVVADALRLMQFRDEVVAMKRERLRDALERGYEDIAAVRVIELETEDEIDALFTSL